jgi:uncharacterized protein YchJ
MLVLIIAVILVGFVIDEYRIKDYDYEEDYYDEDEDDDIEENDEADNTTIRKHIDKKAVKIGRNKPCLCGSGKKYKYCCGK